MAKLNQLVAASQTRKSQLQQAWTAVYRKVGKEDLLTGLTRVYTPKNEDGETKPTERKRVQYTAAEAIAEVSKALTELFDLTATIDRTNTVAKADVVVDGTTLLWGVPATHLLFLEKQLVDLRTFAVEKLPVLDPAEEWNLDANAGDGIYSSPEYQSLSTAKVMQNHVLSPATDKHPANVQVYTIDQVVGSWAARKFSGALPRTQVQAIVARIETLQKAVKFAREEANMTEESKISEGAILLDYAFNG
jgi:hypothetical protein